jgi:hypothetical protein
MPKATMWRNVLPWQVQRMAVPFFKVKGSFLQQDAPSELLGIERLCLITQVYARLLSDPIPMVESDKC